MWLLKELATLTVLGLVFSAMWVWVDYFSHHQTVLYGW
jgi:hypothetical protein